MKQNRGNAVLSGARRVVIGLVAGYLLVFAVCAICAAMIYSGRINQSAASYCALPAILAGAMVGALVTIKPAEGQSLIQALICGTAFYVGLLCAGGLFFEGEMHGVWETALVVSGGSFAATLLKGRGKKLPYKGKRKYKISAFVQI